MGGKLSIKFLCSLFGKLCQNVLGQPLCAQLAACGVQMVDRIEAILIIHHIGAGLGDDRTVNVLDNGILIFRLPCYALRSLVQIDLHHATEGDIDLTASRRNVVKFAIEVCNITLCQKAISLVPCPPLANRSLMVLWIEAEPIFSLI